MKKTRTADTVSGAIKAMADASSPPPEVPSFVTLRPDDVPFWDAIIASRAREEWKQSDLVLAAQLARCQCDIEIEQKTLYAEGTVVPNDRGTKVTNPRFRAINELKASQLSTVRALSLHALAKADAREIGKKRSTFLAAQNARKQVEEEDSEELLAR